MAMRGKLSGKAGRKPEPNSTMRASAKAAAIDHDAVELFRRDVAVEFDLAAGLGDARMQFRQHAPGLDMAFIRIEQPLAKAAFQRRLEFAHALCVQPPMAAGQLGKAL